MTVKQISRVRALTITAAAAMIVVTSCTANSPTNPGDETSIPSTNAATTAPTPDVQATVDASVAATVSAETAPTIVESPQTAPKAASRVILPDLQPSAEVLGLTLTVDGYEVIRSDARGDVLRIFMKVKNDTDSDISLPIFGYFLAVDDLGNAYEGEPFASQWPDTFPSGTSVSGSVDLTSPVPTHANKLSVSFKIFGSLDHVGKSIKVSDVPLQP